MHKFDQFIVYCSKWVEKLFANNKNDNNNNISSSSKCNIIFWNLASICEMIYKQIQNISISNLKLSAVTHFLLMIQFQLMIEWTNLNSTVPFFVETMQFKIPREQKSTFYEFWSHRKKDGAEIRIFRLQNSHLGRVLQNCALPIGIQKCRR